MFVRMIRTIFVIAGVIAIEPVVHHVFLKSSVIANTSEIKELETQRDVLFTMLLKLIHNSRVSNCDFLKETLKVP